jgi:hypothetical protein
MADLSLPFIKWRDGRPKFAPGPRERGLGFVGQDLRHGPDGAWFTYEEAKSWSDARQVEIVATRAGGKRKRAIARRGSTIADLLEDWMRSDRFAALATTSQDSYRKSAAAVLYKPETRAEAKLRRDKTRAAALLEQEPPARPSRSAPSP